MKQTAEQYRQQEKTMKRKIAFMAMAAMTAAAFATDIKVTNFRYTGPMLIHRPVMVDSVGFTGNKYSENSMLDTPTDLSRAADGAPYSGVLAPGCDEGAALHLLHFTIDNSNYTKAKVSAGKMKNVRIYIDGKAATSGSPTVLEPKTHNVVIKYLSQKGKQDSLKVTVSSDDATMRVSDAGQPRLYSLKDVMTGKRVYGVDLSHDGRYLITTTYDTHQNGRTTWRYLITDQKTGRKVLETGENIKWMPNSNAYYTVREGNEGRELVVTDVVSQESKTIAKGLAKGNFTIAPNGKFMVITQTNNGPADDRDVHEIVSPEDRQPGWRNRSALHLYDFGTGVCSPLTFGYHNVRLQDISADGRYLLFATHRNRLTERPTSLSSLYRLDLTTMKTDTLITDEGFMNGASFSPDGQQVVVTGSPECLGGIGKNVPEGRIPNAYDYQLFTIDIATGKATALTRNFNPSVESVVWNRYDGRIYFTAADKDYVHLYRIDAKNGKIEQIATPEDLVSSISLADHAPVMAWLGKGASNSDRVYTLSTANKKSTLVADYSAEKLKDVALGVCEAWDFTSSRGDTICGRYYLPPHFDANAKYPMIVYYYGGCSPTSRGLETHYPPHVYAAQGYVVYVINPSGAAGFGQEFASRHVNTAGQGVANDIIEGTRKFAETHPYVDAKKIGCIGASYGGFMTQYLQTQTDLFAAAVSHAGISDHTSYWGEGYWGYSYSEVSMANSYPWKDKKLYVEQSPLYNADKIHTPILFLHGTADTNVPVGESIQMYTALKLLGRECALVEVEGENHHILDFNKRIKWQNTIFAWFAKWLQDDDTWWKAIYKPKNL